MGTPRDAACDRTLGRDRRCAWLAMGQLGDAVCDGEQKGCETGTTMASRRSSWRASASEQDSVSAPGQR